MLDLLGDLTFKTPSALRLTFVVGVAVIAYLVMQLRRGDYAARFASPAMHPNVVVAGAGWRRHVPVLLYLIGALVLVVGLARPQTYVEVPRRQSTVMLALDSSNSMEGTDIEPSRIRVEKSTAIRFIESLPSRWEIGLITFSGTADFVMSPTTDRIAVATAIQRMELRAGTAIGDAIAEALPSRKITDPLTVVLLTDGNDNVGLVDPLAAARRARRLEIPVYTIGLGAPGLGAIGDEAKPANFDILRRIARITDGEFFTADDEETLDNVYRDLRTKIVYANAPREVTSAFAAGGLAVLALGAFLSALWFNRIP